ncbi:hypothetical protein NA56DRAFT_436933 [Hyaloscypha hepaticicola]|uniref:Uncharacterized protein n=1 Tax=Hyaloscypha hepaticicola TaxID=2082293 RepID=A0A2J6QGW6_9HELO|nr:hypothetical protein NA56DRAFT_436933 [Hyaloscypha hepaticicola]
MDLDAINATVARLEGGEPSTSTLTLKRALKELSSNSSAYRPPPPTSETVDPRLLTIIDSKLRAESLAVSAEYAARFLVENDNKLVPTIYAIKSDLATRENNLNGAGRISVRLEWEIMTWSNHPAALYKDEVLALLEEQDFNIRDLAEKGWNSSYAQKMVNTIQCKEDQQIEFAYYVSENKFREKRAAAYAQFREEGKNFKQLENAIYFWEQQELAKLYVTSVNEAHIEHQVRMRRSAHYRNRLQPVQAVDQVQVALAIEKASAAKGEGPVIVRKSKSASSSNVAGHSGTTNKASSDKGKGPAVAGTSKSPSSLNVAGHSGPINKASSDKGKGLALSGTSQPANSAGPSGITKKDASLKVPAFASTSTSSNAAGHSGTINKASSDKSKGRALPDPPKSANIAGPSGTSKKEATLKAPASTVTSNSSNATSHIHTTKQDASLKVPAPALPSTSSNAAGPSGTYNIPTISITPPPPITASATFNYAEPTGIKLFLFQYLYEIKVELTGEGCNSCGGGAWLENISALRELHTFQIDWAPTAVTIANNSAALAKAMIDAMEEPILIYLRAIMREEEICQYKVEAMGLEFGCWLMEKYVDSVKTGKGIDLGPQVVPGGILGGLKRGDGPSGAASPSGTSAGGSSGGGCGGKKQNKKGKKKN